MLTSLQTIFRFGIIYESNAAVLFSFNLVDIFLVARDQKFRHHDRILMVTKNEFLMILLLFIFILFNNVF